MRSRESSCFGYDCHNRQTTRQSCAAKKKRYTITHYIIGLQSLWTNPQVIRLQSQIGTATGKRLHVSVLTVKKSNEDDDKSRKALKFYSEAVEFITNIQNAVPTLCQLLGSKNTTDVLEGIQFFITASRFNLENAIVGIRKMMMLIWSKETGVREAVINAYTQLYLGEENKDPARVAKNLIK